MGSGHAVVTVRSSILKKFSPKYRSKVYMGKSSETDYIDIPIDRSGMMRLSTINNYAYHMGNTPEDWFYDITSDSKLNNLRHPNFDIQITCQKKIILWTYRFRKKIVSVIFKFMYR